MATHAALAVLGARHAATLAPVDAGRVAEIAATAEVLVVSMSGRVRGPRGDRRTLAEGRGGGGRGGGWGIGGLAGVADGAAGPVVIALEKVHKIP